MDLNRIRRYVDNIRESASPDRRILAKVVGVTFDGRQEVLAKVSFETPIKLERDRRNEFDFYAVKVLAHLDGVWEQVGFLPRQMSRKISQSLDSGVKVSAAVHRLIGGMTNEQTGEKFNYGLEISIE